jgi:hypothetical protein
VSWNDPTEKRCLEMSCFTVGFVVEELNYIAYSDYLLPPTTTCCLPFTTCPPSTTYLLPPGDYLLPPITTCRLHQGLHSPLSLDIFTTARRFLPVQKWANSPDSPGTLPMQWDTPPKEYPSPVITPAYFGHDILQQPVSLQNEYTYVPIGSEQVQLLRLAKGRRDDPIHCSLKVMLISKVEGSQLGY